MIDSQHWKGGGDIDTAGGGDIDTAGGGDIVADLLSVPFSRRLFKGKLDIVKNALTDFWTLDVDDTDRSPRH